MKNILTIAAVLLSVLAFAQDSTKVKTETPKLISKLMYGKAIEVQDLKFKFVAVETDSRCPEGVQCVWAGEAIVLIDVFKNGKKIEQKRVIISPTARLQSSLGNFFSSETLIVSGLSLKPYPKFSNKIKSEDYFIMLDVRE